MVKTYRIGSGKIISTIPVKGCVTDNDDFYCVVCGRQIVGRSYVDNYGNKACAEHGDNIRRCKDCGRILSNEDGVYINGEKWHCYFCHHNAITDETGARNVFNELIDDFKGIGITCRFALAVTYWREYRPMRQMGLDYDVSKSTVCDSVKWCEETLKNGMK